MSGFYTVTLAVMARLKNCSDPTARKELRRVRAELQLAEGQPLMLFQLAALYGAPLHLMEQALEKNKRKLAA